MQVVVGECEYNVVFAAKWPFDCAVVRSRESGVTQARLTIPGEVMAELVATWEYLIEEDNTDNGKV